SAGVLECWSDADPDPHSITPALQHPTSVFDLVASLVDKSLVGVEERGGKARYRLLETTREFAAGALAASGEEDAAREKYAQYFLAVAEQALAGVEGREQARGLDQLEAERDNMRAILEGTLGGGKRDLASHAVGVCLSTALGLFWATCGPVAEGIQWLERALAAERGRTEARALALVAAGRLAGMAVGYDRARRLLLEAIEILEERGDRP